VVLQSRPQSLASLNLLRWSLEQTGQCVLHTKGSTFYLRVYSYTSQPCRKKENLHEHVLNNATRDPTTVTTSDRNGQSACGVHRNIGIIQKVSARRFAPKDSPKEVRHARSRCHQFARQRAASCFRCSIGNFGKVWMASASPPPPPFSPDISPPGFDLFPKLKKPIRGKPFGNNEEVSDKLTRTISRRNRKGVLTEIQDLPRRWTAVIQQDGGYTEGL
jgi:hypothetical protein